mgnify:CR=1 FL=1
MFNAEVIKYLESKNIKCSAELRATHGLHVYVQFKRSPILAPDADWFVLTSAEYFAAKEAGLLVNTPTNGDV